MLIGVLQNAALLIFSAIGIYYFGLLRYRGHRDIGAAGVGLSLGLLCFLVSVTPINLPGETTLDARAGPVVLAGMLAGPLPALIAAAFGALGRSLIGGTFAGSGVLSYGLYAIVGATIWAVTARRGVNPLQPRPLVWGVLLCMLATGAMFFIIQPRELASAWLVQDFPLIAITNTLSIAFLGLVAWVATTAAEQHTRLNNTLKTLELARDSAQLGIWQWDPATQTTSYDTTFLRLHGLDPNDLPTPTEMFARVVHTDDQARVIDQFQKAAQGYVPFDVEYRVPTLHGKTLTLKTRGLVMPNAGRGISRMVGVSYDLTALRHQEAELAESRKVIDRTQRLDVIGKLTRGIAYDFSNLLAVIQGNLELLIEDEACRRLRQDQRADMLASTIAATRKGVEMTRNMSAFAMNAPLEPKRIDVNRTVRDTEKWLARTLPSTISIDINLQARCWPAKLDEGGLQSAIVNIIVEARDSMPAGGQLRIETANIHIEDSVACENSENMPPGRYVMLAISDTGNSLPIEQIGHIFEPSSDPQDPRQGNGLALSMVHGFANQSGGFVRMNSDIGRGSTFKLFFPADGSDEIAAVAPIPKPPNSASPRTAARLLVCEDEFEVMAVLVRILQSAGYHVETASSGDEGLAFLQNGSKFDLFVTDIVMPGYLQGPGLAREARRLQPNLPVIFLSGYANKALIPEADLKPGDTRLIKPIEKSDLLHTVEKSLRRAQFELNA